MMYRKTDNLYKIHRLVEDKLSNRFSSVDPKIRQSVYENVDGLTITVLILLHAFHSFATSSRYFIASNSIGREL